MVFPHCLEVLGLNFNNKNSRKCIYSDCENKRTSYSQNNNFTQKSVFLVYGRITTVLGQLKMINARKLVPVAGITVNVLSNNFSKTFWITFLLEFCTGRPKHVVCECNALTGRSKWDDFSLNRKLDKNKQIIKKYPYILWDNLNLPLT